LDLLQVGPHRLDDDEILRVAGMVASRLTVIVDGAVFEQLRATDRYCLTHLSSWLELELAAKFTDIVRLRDVLDHVLVFAEMLSRVNDRAALKTHDRSIRDKALQRFDDLMAHAVQTPGSARWNQYFKLLSEVRTLIWRDPHLAGYVAREIELGSEDSLLGRIRASSARIKAIAL